MNQATVAVPFELDQRELNLSDFLDKVSTWYENMEDTLFAKMIEEGDKSKDIDTKQVISYIEEQNKGK